MDQFHQELVIGASPEEIKSRMDAWGRQGYRLISAGVNVTPTSGSASQMNRYFWAFMEKSMSAPSTGDSAGFRST